MAQENSKKEDMPMIHPNCAIAQAKDNTPAPTTAVIICALAVHTVPA